MRPVIEEVESRVMLAAHLPSSAGVTHAASVTRIQLTRAKAVTTKSLGKIKADFVRLKLSKTQATLIKKVTADSTSGYKSLASDINVANVLTSGPLHTLIADVLAEARHPSDAAVAKIESDVQAILDKSGASLTGFLSASLTFANTISADLSQIVAAAPSDAKLQADVSAALAAQSAAQAELTTAAQAWLSTAISALGVTF